MDTDIVQRVRELASPAAEEAAQEIERLRSALKVEQEQANRWWAMHLKAEADTAAECLRLKHKVRELEEDIKQISGHRYRAECDVERLQSLTRFQDGVIRSGDVACLTQAERQALERAAIAYELLPSEGAVQVSEVLSGLLERLGGVK